VREILPTLETWTAEGRRIAVATLVERQGSAPRDAGASLALSAGEIAGSVTGGCVEPAVIQEAEAVLARGGARVRTYGIADDEAFEVGLSCGGTVAIAVYELDNRLVRPLADAVAADQPIAMTVRVDGADIGAQRLVVAGDDGDDLAAAAGRLLAAGESAIVEAQGGPAFVASFAPRPAMYVFGAIDHAGALARVGKILGYRVTVCDARAAFVTRERFPDADELVVDWPDRFLRTAPVDERTAICVLTHDHKFDVPALVAALETDAGYIGAMGSRKTTAEREERLRAAGVGDAGLARIHAPIGLPIGARTPEAVAVAIAAQIVEVSSVARSRAAVDAVSVIA
jgi:xanthine dehydrogenase accessory factor